VKWENTGADGEYRGQRGVLPARRHVKRTNNRDSGGRNVPPITHACSIHCVLELQTT